MADEDYRRLAAACACGKPARVKYCSDTCKADAKRTRRGCLPRQDWPLTCVECSGCFTATDRKAMYCGNSCKLRAYKRRHGLVKQSRAELGAALASKRVLAEAAKLAREARKKEEAAARRQAVEAKRLAAKQARMCRACGGPLGLFPATVNCCTNECRDDLCRRSKRATKHAYRARLRQATVERFLDVEIFRRDGWRCQICGEPTAESRMGSNHPRAPTLDHIVALANGGAHSRANAQCACRACNSRKADGPALGQMGLWSAPGGCIQTSRAFGP